MAVGVQRNWALGWIVAASVLLALPPAAGAVTGDDRWSEARALIDAGKAADAYPMLAAQEAEAAGDEDFDYLLGVAALDSGRPAEAVFSLERVLAVDPGFLGARMELARAKFDSGDAPGARTQFQYLLGQSPSAATRTVIERYLEALQRPNVARSSELRRYLDFGTGYDSNANGATGSDQFLGFTLDPHSVEASSSFVDVAGGFDHGQGFDNGNVLVTQGRLSHRFNPQADFIDLTVASLGTRLQWAWGGTRFDASANGDVDWLDGAGHQSDLGVGFGVAHRVGGDWDVRVDARALAVRFKQSALKVMDANRWLASVGIARNGGGSRQLQAGALLLVGGDGAEDSASPYDNDRWGARIYAGWSMTQRSTVYAEAAYLATDYADTPGFFGTDRSDRQWSALLATEYQNWPARGWSLAPRIRYIKNDSNVSLYEYDRTEAGIYLRRSFR